MLYLRILCLGFISLKALAWDPHPETGAPFVRTFGPDDHGGQKVNRQMAFDERGNLYVANETGVLKYDGATWSKLPETGHSTFTPAVAVDSEGRVWVAQTRGIGYYEITESGELSYRSLNSEIEELTHSKDLGGYSYLYAQENAIYLCASFGVLRWEDSQWQAWTFDTDTRVLVSFDRGNMYCHARGQGLFKLVDDDLVKIHAPDTQIDSGVISILRDDLGRMVYVTVSQGFWYNDKGTLKRFETEIDQLLQNTLVIHAIALGDLIAICTVEHGILLVDPKGRLLDRIELSKGFIEYLITHPETGLWAAGSHAVYNIPFDNYISYFEIGDQVDDLIRYQSALHAACRLNTRVLNRRAGPKVAEMTVTAEEIVPSDLLSLDKELIQGGAQSISIFNEDGHRRQIDHSRPTTILSRSLTDETILYLVDQPFVSRLRRTDGDWHFQNTLRENPAITLSIVELPDGSVLRTTESGPVTQIIWPKENNQMIETQIWSVDRGLPESFQWAYCLEIRGEYLLITNEGLYRYNLSKQKFSFDPALGQDLGNDAYGLEYAQLAEEDGWAIWLPSPENPTQRGLLGALRLKNNYVEWEKWRIPTLENLGRIESILHEKEDGNEILWLGGWDRLFRLNLDRLPAFEAREVRLSLIRENQSGATYYGGNGPAPESLDLQHPARELQFSFATKEGRLSVLGFQSRLLGFEKEWSPPTQLNSRTFTNLYEGKYTFEFRAIDELNRVGPTETFRFTIHPPLYRSVIAYLIYCFLLFLIVFSIARWWGGRFRRRNEELERTVQERTVELERRNIELMKANSVKQTFLASMSHEIRNPLNGILGIANLLGQNTENDSQKEKFKHLNSCAKHLHQLLGQVLDYSSIEAGKLRVRETEFNPAEIVDEVIDMHRELAEKNGFELKLDLPKLESLWIGDPVLIRQVLINLISNAIKYGGRGKVRIQLNFSESAEAVHAQFTVADNGPGIPIDKQDFIFDDFTRLSKTGESSIAGTGLGLAIARRLALLMRGTLCLDSDYQNGARFILELTLRKGQAIQLENDTANIVSSTDVLKTKKVLVADDMDFNRFVCREVLEQLGSQVEEASNGLEALQQLRTTRFDVAILDINMPELSGIEAAKKFLREKPSHRPLMIALTAHATSEMEKRARAAGFSHFLEKPLEPNKLIPLLQKGLGQSPLIDTSLLDYIAANNPQVRERLQKRFLKSFDQELARLKTACSQLDYNLCSDHIHKLRGLANIQRKEGLISKLHDLSEAVRGCRPRAELLDLCEHLQFEIDHLPN